MIDNRKDYKLVLVIGNGFDLDLGLPTSYKDFLESSYFRSHLNTEIVTMKYDKDLKEGNNLFRYLREKYVSQNWIDIEKELKFMASRQTKAVDRHGRVYDALPVASDAKKTFFELLCNQLCLYLNNLDYIFVQGNSTALNLLVVF